MNIKSFILLAAFSTILDSAFGQGALTPPGAPAPTMKSLDQIEARTPISSAPFTITQPGSYYATTNLTVSTNNGITIATNNVRLDLNGFTISSTAPSATGSGVWISGSWKNITLLNGFIQGSVTNNGSNVYSGGGFQAGIWYAGPGAPVNVLVSGITVSGCSSYGINVNTANSTVESCNVQTVGSYGIYATTVRNCNVIDAGYTGIYAILVSDSRGSTGSGSYGINAAGSALNCYGTCSGAGTALNSLNALNCYGYNSSDGIGLSASSSATCCYGYSYSGVGLYGFMANGSHGASYSGTAISVTHNVNSF